MLAHYWYEQSIAFDAIDGRTAAARDDNEEALDDWLASLSVNQFECILNALMSDVGDRWPALGRSA